MVMSCLFLFASFCRMALLVGFSLLLIGDDALFSVPGGRGQDTHYMVYRYIRT